MEEQHLYFGRPPFEQEFFAGHSSNRESRNEILADEVFHPWGVHPHGLSQDPYMPAVSNFNQPLPCQTTNEYCPQPNMIYQEDPPPPSQFQSLFEMMKTLSENLDVVNKNQTEVILGMQRAQNTTLHHDYASDHDEESHVLREKNQSGVFQEDDKLVEVDEKILEEEEDRKIEATEWIVADVPDSSMATSLHEINFEEDSTPSQLPSLPKPCTPVSNKTVHYEDLQISGVKYVDTPKREGVFLDLEGSLSTKHDRKLLREIIGVISLPAHHLPQTLEGDLSPPIHLLGFAHEYDPFERG